MTACPHCGYDPHGDNPIRMTMPQYRRQSCTFNGIEVSLSPLETEILATLLLLRGRNVKMTDLVAMVYQHPELEPEWPERSLDVLLVRLRKKLPNLIKSRNGYGHFIDRPGGRW